MSSCLTCNTTTTCLTCDSNLFRTFVTNQCNCISHYYLSGGVCLPCDYSCLECLASAANCQKCQTGKFRTHDSIAFTCKCDSGYYDNGIAKCAKCSYQCLTCDITAINCLICAGNRLGSNCLTCPA